VKHHAALPYDELPDFISALRVHAGVAARALEFLILTAARTGEVIAARAAEINAASCSAAPRSKALFGASASRSTTRSRSSRKSTSEVPGQSCRGPSY
jgi:integrase